LVFAVPFSIGARIFSDSGVAVILSLCAAIGFLLGAAVAAWHQQRRTPLSHAIVTAALSYIIPQIGAGWRSALAWRLFQLDSHLDRWRHRWLHRFNDAKEWRNA
jgi:tryptophan 2,3-dioxygenase